MTDVPAGAASSSPQEPSQEEPPQQPPAGPAPGASWRDLAGDPAGSDVDVVAAPVRRRPAHGVLTLERPTVGDPIVRQASAVIGGPAGRRMAVGRSVLGPGGGVLWITLVLTLLSALTLGFGAVTKAHCINSGWSTPDQFWHACYSDVPVLYGSADLGGAKSPSLVTAVGPNGLGQPPLAAAAMWVMAKATGGGSGTGPARTYFLISAVLMAAALAVAVASVIAAAGRRPWDAAHVALAPVVVTGGLISYDLLAVALLAVAVLAWSRRHPVAGGLVLGAAIATRPVTALVILAVLVLAVRTGQARSFVAFSLPAVAAWLGIRLVLLPGSTGGLSDALKAWRRSGPGYGSLWMVPGLIGQSQPDKLKAWSVLSSFWYKGQGLSSASATMCVMVALVLVWVATAFLGLSVTDRPRFAHLTLFAVAGSLIVIKSVPVQAGLILLPLIALAGLRWRDHLIWATTELTYFVAVWLYIASSSDPNKGLPATIYMLLLLARIGGIVWIMAQAVRAMRDPLCDPVRVPPDGSQGADDPQGGEFEGADDALVVRLV